MIFVPTSQYSIQQKEHFLLDGLGMVRLQIITRRPSFAFYHTTSLSIKGAVGVGPLRFLQSS